MTQTCSKGTVFCLFGLTRRHRRPGPARARRRSSRDGDSDSGNASYAATTVRLSGGPPTTEPAGGRPIRRGGVRVTESCCESFDRGGRAERPWRGRARAVSGAAALLRRATRRPVEPARHRPVSGTAAAHRAASRAAGRVAGDRPGVGTRGSLKGGAGPGQGPLPAPARRR